MKTKTKTILFGIGFIGFIFNPITTHNSTLNQAQLKIQPKLEKIQDNPFKEIKATVYAYNAEIGQTDNNPCLTADGTNVCQNPQSVIANNCLKFGTKVELNNKTYIVKDRMNKRYDCNDFDILMLTKQEALNFGKKYLTIKIYDFKKE